MKKYLLISIISFFFAPILLASAVRLPAGSKEEKAVPLWEKQMQYAMNDNPMGLKLTATGGYKDNVVRILKVGMGFVKVTWSYKGKEYKSIAVVSDDEGIIYDPIGFGVIIKK
jgi:hypothetical protein